MLATMNTSQRRNLPRSLALPGGTSESLPVMSASSSVIAALSLMTLPSGISSVGTWASGLTFFSLASASGVRNRSSTASKV